MLEFEEYEDILTPDEINQIYSIVSSESFPWYLSKTSVKPLWHKDKNTREYLQFVHLFNTSDGKPNSNYIKLSDDILNRFLVATGKTIKNRYKTKVNFQPRIENFLPNQYNTPHVDRDEPHYVVLYYPHTTDGDTFIFDRTENSPFEGQYNCIKRITPKAGKYIIFNGDHYHAGSHPSQNDYRIVFNYNLTLNE